MNGVKLQLFGIPSIYYNGAAIKLPLKKAEGLLYYLCVNKTVSREKAATLLWGESDELTAKKNLRHTLYTIKKAFEGTVVILANHHLLMLNPEISIFSDYENFIESKTATLYQGEFLQGFVLKNSEEFEIWMSLERTRLQQMYLDSLYSAMTEMNFKSIQQIEEYFSAYLSVDELDERVYLLMMTAYKENGLYYKGIKLYDRLNNKLEEELGICPNQEIHTLRKTLLKKWSAFSADEKEQKEKVIGFRAAEEACLMERYHRFLKGESQALCLYGEYGMGKSYLMNSFLNRVADPEQEALSLRITCFQAETEIPLQPWQKVVIQIKNAITRLKLDIPEPYNAIITTFPLFGSPVQAIELTQEMNISYNIAATQNAILHLLKIVSDKIPMVLAFDNLQFMDIPSCELFFRAVHSSELRVMTVVTCLDPYKLPRQAYIKELLQEELLSKIQLLPFTKEATEAIIAQKLKIETVEGTHLDTIYNATEGNPFYLEMMLNDLREDNFKHILSLKNKNLLKEKLSGLLPDQRQILDIIALFHDYASLDILAYILRADTMDIIKTLEELKLQGVIQEVVNNNIVEIKFRYYRLREFVYEQLSISKRRLLHDRVAKFILEKPSVKNYNWYKRLIYHFEESGNQANALYYKVMAFEYCLCSEYELYPILHPTNSAGEEGEKDITSVFETLKCELHDLYFTQPSSIDYDETEVHLLYAYGKYNIMQGQYKEGLAAINQALHNDFVKDNPNYHVLLLRQRTYYGIQIWDLACMKENIEQALVITREHGLPIQYAIECRLYGLYFSMTGDYDTGQEYQRRSIERLETHTFREKSLVVNIAAAYNYLGEFERKQGHYEASLDYYHQAIQLCKSNQCGANPTFYTNLGRSLIAMGQADEAEKYFEVANAIYDDTSILMRQSIAKGYLAMIRAKKHDFKAAKQLLLEARACGRKLSSPVEIGLLATAEAVLLLAFPEEFGPMAEHSAKDYLKEARTYLKITSCHDEFNIIMAENVV